MPQRMTFHMAEPLGLFIQSLNVGADHIIRSIPEIIINNMYKINVFLLLLIVNVALAGNK